jgi:hypothetical protein
MAPLAWKHLHDRVFATRFRNAISYKIHPQSEIAHSQRLVGDRPQEQRPLFPSLVMTARGSPPEGIQAHGQTWIKRSDVIKRIQPFKLQLHDMRLQLHDRLVPPDTRAWYSDLPRALLDEAGHCADARAGARPQIR